ncbi:MAG: tyrosine-type recombinase/integrase [Chitinophagales bacterium]|nr:tyrosine-type recombinase/integrase [Chitinophagales bacterium]
MHLESFLNYLRFEKRYSPHTLLSYQNDLEQFSLFLSSTFEIADAKDVSHTYIRSWMASLMEDGITPRSINRKLSALKSYYKFLIKRGEVLKDPTLKIVSPKTKKRLPTYVEEEKMQQLFFGIEFEEGFSGSRDKMLLELLYGTGMRRAELMNLKLTDINLGQKLIKVLGKGNKERLIPYNTQLEESLKGYLEQLHLTFPTCEWLICNDKGGKMMPEAIYRTVKKYLSMVTTIEKRSPHVLRHTFATHLSNNGAELNAVKELLGHSSLAATQVYTHNNIDKLKDIFKQSHPKA